MSSTRSNESSSAPLRPNRSTLIVLVLLFAIETTLLAWFLTIAESIFAEPRYMIYPFLWINVGLVVVWRITVPPAKWRYRQIAILLSAVYGLVLLYVGGVVEPGYNYVAGEAIALTVSANLPPGWGPIIVYAGPQVSLSMVPYRVIGYLALTYLVYATVVDVVADRPGPVSLLVATAWLWPVVAAVVTGVVGIGGSPTAAALTPSHDVSTVLFVGVVALLYWRSLFD